MRRLRARFPAPGPGPRSRHPLRARSTSRAKLFGTSSWSLLLEAHGSLVNVRLWRRRALGKQAGIDEKSSQDWLARALRRHADARLPPALGPAMALLRCAPMAAHSSPSSASSFSASLASRASRLSSSSRHSRLASQYVTISCRNSRYCARETDLSEHTSSMTSVASLTLISTFVFGIVVLVVLPVRARVIDHDFS